MFKQLNLNSLQRLFWCLRFKIDVNGNYCGLLQLDITSSNTESGITSLRKCSYISDLGCVALYSSILEKIIRWVASL